MQFVDEAQIHVIAGKGGNGVCSFRREKYIPFGGPNGGDGGDGGSIIMVADRNVNTLVDFRFVHEYKAQNGQAGMGQQKYGRGGEDLIIRVPVGTTIKDLDSLEMIGDLTKDGESVVVAQGGEHGLGNIHFKSSRNRSPRQFTLGEKGDERHLLLELSVLADVGLLGLPNAGKSSLITSVSSARPKVADYPFTTLYPNLGVVRVSPESSFVIADVPGLIEGAAEGAGLGIQFLKHLARTGLLLHVVDIAPIDGSDPVESARVIQNELSKYSLEILDKPRWLVLNKIDLLLEEEANELCDRIVAELEWTDPVYRISAINRQGTEDLSKAIAYELEQNKQKLADEAYEKRSAAEAKRVDEANFKRERIADTVQAVTSESVASETDDALKGSEQA